MLLRNFYDPYYRTKSFLIPRDGFNIWTFKIYVKKAHEITF